ncbi:NAD-dependent epimerase/dehydratase family protein [Phenylobacterium sp.]|uniref:NAD-dependent epimerase/dehydratase family protein n=1 Tax=Phenylobacterium sp. TaxID=1871053 RepID=UPI002FDAC2A4
MAGPVLVTGAAGFVGMHVAERLLQRGEEVVGLDVFNAYYDPALKAARAERLAAYAGFSLVRTDVAEADALAELLAGRRITRVVHLAAQAGVRYSLENPFAYERSNLAGHLAVLEACRRAPDFAHLVYASSSSVYGDRPGAGEGFTEDDAAAEPVSLYAATKRSCELMSFAYGRLYGLSQTGLRFFTVYGPWGRPDMAYYSFTRKILADEPIEVFGEGRMARDFTYIDDIVDGVIGALDRPPQVGVNRILNIGDSRPVGLMRMIEVLEKALGKPANKVFKPMQPGDVTQTYADISRLAALTGYAPKVALEEGLPRFVDWYRRFNAR